MIVELKDHGRHYCAHIMSPVMCNGYITEVLVDIRAEGVAI